MRVCFDMFYTMQSGASIVKEFRAYQGLKMTLETALHPANTQPFSFLDKATSHSSSMMCWKVSGIHILDISISSSEKFGNFTSFSDIHLFEYAEDYIRRQVGLIPNKLVVLSTKRDGLNLCTL